MPPLSIYDHCRNGQIDGGKRLRFMIFGFMIFELTILTLDGVDILAGRRAGASGNFRLPWRVP
jgi:hypothetical protein